MQKCDFRQKVDSMLPELMQAVRDESTRLYECGGIDSSSYEDDYILPKICLTGAIENQVRQYMPFHPDYRREVSNLKKF